MGGTNCDVSVTRGRMPLLLGSACVAALLLGSGTSPALAAACAINVVNNPASAAINNTTNFINCINVQNSNVAGNVANSAPNGVIITNATSANTGIRIDHSTLTGSVVNSG